MLGLQVRSERDATAHAGKPCTNRGQKCSRVTVLVDAPGADHALIFSGRRNPRKMGLSLT